MRHSVYIILIILVAILSLPASDILPKDQFLPGWVKNKSPKKFTSSNLYGHINGGAELFLEFGFEELLIQEYHHKDQKIDVELYRMLDPVAALGIYLMKAGVGEAAESIPARNSGNRYQLTLTSGNYFIQINNFSGKTENQPIMFALGSEIIRNIGPVTEFQPGTFLPKGEIVQNSMRLFRGPYALQAIYTFGAGDIFQLDRKTYGVASDYHSENDGNISVVVISYPEEALALKAFQNITVNLDPYLKVLEQSDTVIVFIDYKDKFGKIQIENDKIIARIHLASRPD